MKECYYKSTFCENCNIYNLKKIYIKLLPFLKREENCHQVFRGIASFLFNLLSRSPHALYGKDAFTLIDAITVRLEEEDLLLGMNLCSVAIQCFLFLGLDKRNISCASKLLTYYKIYLDRFYCASPSEEYVVAYCDYYSLLFQFYHLIEDYSFVTKEYETKYSSDDIIRQHGDRIVSQYTASKWLGSSTRNERNYSRDVAEKLMSNVQARRCVEGSDFFITAKYLEHHIQSGTPGDGVNEVINLLNTPHNVNDILLLSDAINETILYRDLYEAVIKSDQDSLTASSFLNRALQIANLFNLQDQLKKIRKVERDMSQESNSSKYSIGSVHQMIINEGDMKNPILYNNSSFFDAKSLRAGIIELLKKSDVKSRGELLDALSALEEENEGKFKKAMKKAVEVCGNIFSNLASDVLVAYLRQNEIIP